MVRRALREVVGLYWESGVGDDVPALAWFLLSSLAPLALGLTALATVALARDQLHPRLRRYCP